MDSPVLFCHRIRDGKLQATKDFVHACINDKYDEYSDLLKRYDLNDTCFWFAESAGHAFMLFTHDMGPTGFDCLAEWGGSTHPFDQWFNDQLNALFVTEDPVKLDFFEAIKV